MTSGRFQEVLNDFPFSNFLKQVDGENWRLHLLLFNAINIQALRITSRKVEGSINKKAGSCVALPCFLRIEYRFNS